MATTKLARTVDGKVEEAHVMVWNGVRIMRGTPSPDGPQGSFEKIDVSGAKADAVARERIARLRAEGFEPLVDTPKAPTKPQKAARPPAPQAPSRPRPVAAPAWTKRLAGPAGEAIAKQLAKLRKTIAKVGLGHRSLELEALARPGVDFSVKRAKPGDLTSVVSRIGGDPDLPPGMRWPTAKGVPLAFVAQIAMADVKALDLARVLPASGVLSFFAQLDAMKPDYGELGLVVRLATSPKLVRTPAPGGVERIATAGLLSSRPRLTLPPRDEPAIEGLGLVDGEAKAYHDQVLLPSIPEGSNHVLGGWATAATHHGMRGKRFLAQIDSDDRIGFEMGDYETLRFYVAGDALDDAALASAVCTMSEA